MMQYFQPPLFGNDVKNVVQMEQYDKFYTVYMFDNIKYHKLLKQFFKEHNRFGVYDLSEKERKDLKKQCYVLDDEGLRIPLGDERHIFRIAVLQKLHEKIYMLFSNNFYGFETEPENIDGLIFYPDELQAELEGTWNLSIKERVLIHIALLKLLRNKLPIKEAVKIIKTRFKLNYNNA